MTHVNKPRSPKGKSWKRELPFPYDPALRAALSNWRTTEADGHTIVEALRKST